MTREEAIERIKDHMEAHHIGEYPHIKLKEALDVALSALRHQIWEDQLWHDAKTDPPKTPGLYYGKKDDTNSMYLCQYRDGIWKLDMYPNCKIDIVQWADYTAFVDRDEESVLRPVAREQVEKVWKGEWIGIPNMGVYDIACSKCGYSTGIRFWSSDFCPNCGAPMTDEAVEIIMERLEEICK